MPDRYVGRKEASQSYRPRSYVMSPGLLRARAPFRVQNAVTGLVLAGFATAVWAYSIRAVKQDDFSDVDDEAREMMHGRQIQTGGASSPSDVDVLGLGATGTPPLDLARTTTGVNTLPSRPRGVLAPILDRAFPQLLDPTTNTLVWGAPPVDNVGHVRPRSTEGPP